MRLVWLSALLASGCCCNPLGGATRDADWRRAVERERENPQLAALAPGTANVFSLEIAQPVATVEELVAERERALALKVAQLELRLSEARRAKGLLADGRPAASPAALEEAWASTLVEQRATLAALEAAPAKEGRQVEVTERLRFVVLWPRVPALEDQGLEPVEACGACINEAHRSRAFFLRSFGHAGVELSALTEAQLKAGVPLEGRVSIGSVGERDTRSLELPPGARATLTLVASCPARVVQRTETLTVGMGSGVIAVPRREERSWTELRDAPCVTSAETVDEVLRPLPPAQPSDGQRRVWQLEAMLEQLR
ncbi:MAG: hypothetical protein ACOZQL_04305 [Myxococcota bacterium]